MILNKIRANDSKPKKNTKMKITNKVIKGKILNIDNKIEYNNKQTNKSVYKFTFKKGELSFNPSKQGIKCESNQCRQPSYTCTKIE